MGQKVHPHGLRVGVIKEWDAKWFANKKDFADNLVEDNKIREFVKKELFSAGISKIEIERAAKRVKLNIYTNLNAMHIYTANHFPDDSTLGKHSETYPLHGGIAFETQLSPNSMQMPWLQSPIIKANDRYQSFTKFKVGLLSDK